jgi:hypothetical protein
MQLVDAIPTALLFSIEMRIPDDKVFVLHTVIVTLAVDDAGT